MLSAGKNLPLCQLQIRSKLLFSHCYCFLHTDDVVFWRAIVQLGLVDEFFREVKARLDVLKANMVKNFVPVDGKAYTVYKSLTKLVAVTTITCQGFEVLDFVC